MARVLQSIFCDDVRQEAGNKLSLMGVYNGQMVVPSFPFEISKLIVSMKASAQEGEEYKSLTFVVMLNDDIITEMPVDEKYLQVNYESIPAIPNVNDVKRNWHYQVFFNINSLKIKQPSIIRTRIRTENGEVRGESLMILKSYDDANGNKPK